MSPVEGSKRKVGTGMSGWCIEARYGPNPDEKHRACIFKDCTCECHGKEE